MSLETAIGVAVTSLQGHAGRSVVYRRGGNSVSLTAAKSHVDVETAGGDGVAVESSRTDWIVKVADLVLAGSATEPIEGDTIEESAGGSTYTYEAMPIGSDACFRRCGDQAYRVHTRLVTVQ